MARFVIIAALLSLCAMAPLARDANAATTPIAFPRDYAQHPAYEREWWSLSGHVATRDGRRFSIRASFFRYSLGHDEALFCAEYAILDVRSGQMESEQRSARDVTASTTATRYSIAVDDWKLEDTPSPRLALRPRSERANMRIRIGGSSGFSLSLAPRKPPVRSLGFDGYSLTRLSATGSLRHDGVRYAVEGSAWLDHEYERSADASERIGWERFELQLQDGRELELFTSREPRGDFRLPSRPHSPDLQAERTIFGTREPMDALLIDRAGRSHRIAPERVALIIEGNTIWHSPHDDATYPALWQLTFENEPAIAIAPLARDQELLPAPNGVALWYGSVDLAQADPPGSFLGYGFVQLAGYLTPTPL